MNELVERARFCFDTDYESNFEIVDRFSKLGFKISITPVSGLLFPHIYLGDRSFDSIEEIDEFLDSLTPDEEAKNTQK